MLACVGGVGCGLSELVGVLNCCVRARWCRQRGLLAKCLIVLGSLKALRLVVLELGCERCVVARKVKSVCVAAAGAIGASAFNVSKGVVNILMG